jgi:phosphatidylglycerophosphatase A
VRSAARLLATFFGIGLLPLHGLSAPLYAVLVVALFFAGVWAAAVHAAALGAPDPGPVVVDEVCGQLVALALLPAGWLPVAVSFALFRFFDIIKPGPIRRLERLPGGWGIMADDVGAGLAAAVLSRLILLVF